MKRVVMIVLIRIVLTRSDDDDLIFEIYVDEMVNEGIDVSFCSDSIVYADSDEERMISNSTDDEKEINYLVFNEKIDMIYLSFR